MKKEVLGLSRKELFIYTFIVFVTLTLIVYSTISLIHKYYTKDQTIYKEIHAHSKDIAYLNDINTYALNVQRNSLNMLVYKANPKEIEELKLILSENRDSLISKLNKINNDDFIVHFKKSEILETGLKYYSINTAYLKIFNDSINSDKLSAYNLEKMRPAIRVFTDLIRKNVTLLIEKIQNVNNIHINLFKQIEFWLLLIALMPYLYFLYRVVLIILRMIRWELFS